MTRGLTARLVAVGAVAFLLCAGTFAVVLTLVRDARTASRRLQLANDRITTANRTLALVVDLETGTRGFAVTHDEHFLEPYRHAVAALPGAKADVLEATVGDARQAATARRLATSVDAYERWQAEQQRRDPGAAAEVIASGAGKTQVDHIRSLVQDVVGRERAAALTERDHVDAASDRVTALAIGALLLAPLLLIALVLRGARGVARPLQRLAVAARRLEEGDLEVRVPERSAGEVGALEHSFNAMAQSLEHSREASAEHNAELEAQGAELARAVEAASHQAEVNRAVLETAHDAFIAVDDDMTITVWTPQATALFGHTERAAVGRRADQLLVPERWRPGYRLEHSKLLADSLHSAATRRFEIPALHASGRRLQVEVSVSPLRIGDRWQVNGFVRDIGQRVARERAREAQRAVSLALAAAPCAADVLPRAMEALGRALHWPLAGLRGPGGDPLAHWRDDTFTGELSDEGMITVPIGDEIGSLVFWQRRAGPLDHELTDALDAISAQVREVYERRRAEEEAERLKNEFFALVSHELRTPLTSIIGYLELLLEDEAGELPSEQRRFLTVVERNARRLQRLVGDLLFVAQVESGTLSLERREVDLAAVIADAVAAGRPRAEQAGLLLISETDPIPPLTGDPDRLAQIIDNLITNAIKFTPAGGTVTVRTRRRDGSAVIEVSDTGVGIAPEEQAKLFERFYRTQDATERSVQGIGLGLSIVRAIALGHGGAVAVDSTDGKGTTFRVELPIALQQMTGRKR